jgi:hypothetical protein
VLVMIISEAAEAGQWRTVEEHEVTVRTVVLYTVDVTREAREVRVLVVLRLKCGALVVAAAEIVRPDEELPWKKIPPVVLE